MFFARYAPSQNLEASLLETPRINMMFGGDWPVVSSSLDSLAQVHAFACIQERTCMRSQALRIEVCVDGDEGALLQ